MKAYPLSSIGIGSVKSPSPHPRGTPDVTGLNADIFISNISVKWLVLMPCIMEISGSSLKPKTSYPDRSSFLIYLFLSGKFQSSMT
jgi:hypothetical protein